MLKAAVWHQTEFYLLLHVRFPESIRAGNTLSKRCVCVVKQRSVIVTVSKAHTYSRKRHCAHTLSDNLLVTIRSARTDTEPYSTPLFAMYYTRQGTTWLILIQTCFTSANRRHYFITMCTFNVTNGTFRASHRASTKTTKQ